MLTAKEIIKKIKSLSSSKNREGMERFGINIATAYGTSVPALRKIAKQIGKNHNLAIELWHTKIHEAQILASMIAEPEKLTEKQMDEWIKDFNSWDVCDQVCLNLFDKTAIAYKKAGEWSARYDEFEKRAGFALMAALATHDKNAPDKNFIKFLPIITRKSGDDRNFVKKSVNWALRQIGKRNLTLNKLAIKTAEEIQKIDSKTAKWMATDALHELTSSAVQDRLQTK
jgi:3-methyladenine DNA glycosylase AlkD